MTQNADSERVMTLATMLYGLHREVEFDTEADRRKQEKALKLARLWLPDIEKRLERLIISGMVQDGDEASPNGSSGAGQ